MTAVAHFPTDRTTNKTVRKEPRGHIWQSHTELCKTSVQFCPKVRTIIYIILCNDKFDGLIGFQFCTLYHKQYQRGAIKD